MRRAQVGKKENFPMNIFELNLTVISEKPEENNQKIFFSNIEQVGPFQKTN